MFDKLTKFSALKFAPLVLIAFFVALLSTNVLQPASGAVGVVVATAIYWICRKKILATQRKKTALLKIEMMTGLGFITLFLLNYLHKIDVPQILWVLTPLGLQLWYARWVIVKNINAPSKKLKSRS